MKNLLIFFAGAAVGAGGAYFFLKDKMEAKTQDEIRSVQKSFAHRLDEMEKRYEAELSQYKDDKKTAENIVDQNYVPEDKSSYNKEELSDFRANHETNYSGTNPETIVKEEPSDIYPTEESSREYPFVISPDIFDSRSDNQQMTLTYYKKSNCLVNEYGEELNIYDTVGEESLKHFGEFEDGVVYVRNNHLGCDYEVILDEVAEVM